MIERRSIAKAAGGAGQNNPGRAGKKAIAPQHPECLMCSFCCRPYFSLYVEEEDEKRWEAEGRRDILERLEWERNRTLWDEEGPYNAVTGERFTRCFYLCAGLDGTATCAIHDAKPKICLDYVPGSSSLCVLFKRSLASDGEKG